MLYIDKFQEAIVDFTQTLMLNLEHANAYYNRGVAYAQQGKHDEAIKEYID